MFGSLQFLAFLNFLLFLTTSLSICPFHINLDWRKGLCGTKARIGKCWGWVWLWESVVLCMHMVSECCTFWIPQLLTHLSLPGKCGINSQCQAVFWLLAAAATLCACCLLAPEWLSASSSCFSSSSFLSPSAGHLSHCSVYNTLILDLVSSCFHQFSLSWKSRMILIVGPVFRAVPLQRSPGLQGRISFCGHFHPVESLFLHNFSYLYSKKDLSC